MTDARRTLDEDSARIVDCLRELTALNRMVERHLAAAMELNSTDLHAMEFLARVRTSTPTALATELGVSTPAATFAVDRLSARGHVSRQPHPDDRRKTVVAPSSAALDEVVELLAPLTGGLAAHLAGMSAEDRRVVRQFLDGVLDVYRSADRVWRSTSDGSPGDR
jgi:DNA-binding MarR family transcriptional regulator